MYETCYAKYSDAKQVCPLGRTGMGRSTRQWRNAVEVLALGTGIGIIGLIVIVLIVILILRIL